MNTGEILALRQHNLRLDSGQLDQPEDVVAWHGAMQAQEFAYAKWMVGQRTSGRTESDLAEAFADGRILRTHLLRPTWHFVAREDIRWVLAATAQRVHQLNAFMYRQTELDERLLAKTDQILVDTLSDGMHRTRKELQEALAEHQIDAESMRLGYIVHHAELEGLICSGAPNGKQHTYALISEQAPNARVLSPDDALAELARRYFLSHGPATAKDFATWASLTVSEVRRGLEMNSGTLQKAEVEGRTYWFAEPTVDRPPIPAPTAHLIQGYDEYVMGYGESKDLITRHPPEAIASGNPFLHSVLLDGQMVGTWQRSMKKAAVQVEIRLHRSLKSAQRDAIADAAERLGDYYELPVAMTANLPSNEN